jgi:hypothetical protein
MGRIATGIDLFRHGATAVEAGHFVSMPALFGSTARQAQRAKPGSLFSDRLLRRLVFGRLFEIVSISWWSHPASAVANSSCSACVLSCWRSKSICGRGAPKAGSSHRY